MDEGLEWMIRDYEMAVHQQGDELDVGAMYVLSPMKAQDGKTTQWRCNGP